jgi:SAM-dependent methyltransferase
MTIPRTGHVELGQFFGAAADETPSAFRRLVASIWNSGTLTADAEVVAGEVVDALVAPETRDRGQLAVLLGMLLESDNRTDELIETVRAGLDRYLELLAGATDDPGLTLSLVYLLGHFPADRERILPVALARGLDADDQSRLERVLTPCDPADEAEILRIGRRFPSPAGWEVSDEELEQIGGWVRWLNITDADTIAMLWNGETNTLLSYSGAKALWTVEHGEIGQTSPAAVSTKSSEDAYTGDVKAWLERYADVLRCAECKAPLAVDAAAATCPTCSVTYPVAADGFLDVVGGEDEMSDPLLPRFHEKLLRPAFMRLVGGNWAGTNTAADEIQWLTDYMRPVDGPILDMGPGAGTSSKAIADVYGADRVLAIDTSAAMLARLKQRVPGAAALRASITAIPLADAILGAVSCWNFLHPFSDKVEVLAEISRCLRPGGSFTLMSPMPYSDPVAAYFQGRLGETVPRELFGPREITEWLNEVGLTVKDMYFPGGNYMILRAERRAA